MKVWLEHSSMRTGICTRRTHMHTQGHTQIQVYDTNDRQNLTNFTICLHAIVLNTEQSGRLG